MNRLAKTMVILFSEHKVGEDDGNYNKNIGRVRGTPPDPLCL